MLKGNAMLEKCSPEQYTRKLGQHYRNPKRPKRHDPVGVSLALYLSVASAQEAKTLLSVLKAEAKGAPGTAKASIYGYQWGSDTVWDIQVAWMDADEVGAAYAAEIERSAGVLGFYQLTNS
jgi:hypothetical protein